jgi:hypothetical protein
MQIMSFAARLVIWLHVAFAIFAIGPLTVVTMSTPRYLRARNLPVLRYLSRMTRVFSAVSVGVLVFGLVAAQLRNDFSRPWLSVSMTLFVVALVLLLLVMRDQRRAITALARAGNGEGAQPGAVPAGTPEPVPAGTVPPEAAGTVPAGAPAGGGQPGAGDAPDDSTAAAAAAAPAAEDAHLASVERGRIASMAGLVSIIWLVILALMIWQP